MGFIGAKFRFLPRIWTANCMVLLTYQSQCYVTLLFSITYLLTGYQGNSSCLQTNMANKVKLTSPSDFTTAVAATTGN